MENIVIYFAEKNDDSSEKMCWVSYVVMVIVYYL